MVITDERYPDSKVHGANMRPTWDLSAPDGSHVGPINLAIRVLTFKYVLQDSDVGVNDIEKMPYLDMVVQESLRLHPLGAV